MRKLNLIVVFNTDLENFDNIKNNLDEAIAKLNNLKK